MAAALATTLFLRTGAAALPATSPYSLDAPPLAAGPLDPFSPLATQLGSSLAAPLRARVR